MTTLSSSRSLPSYLPDENPWRKTNDHHIGYGAYGVVEEVIHSSDSSRIYARKTSCIRDNRNYTVAVQEIKLMQSLAHLHIVNIVDAYERPATRTTELQTTEMRIGGLFICYVMDPRADCDLGEFLNYVYNPTQDRHHEPAILSWFGCLATGLAFLHHNQVKHNDIKPSNILVKADKVFLADFGLSRSFAENSNSKSHGPAYGGTRRYSPLETLESSVRGKSVDVFSLGCVFAEMWTVLLGRTIADLDEFRCGPGRRVEPYAMTVQETLQWITVLRTQARAEPGVLSDVQAFPTWQVWMFHDDPNRRPEAAELAHLTPQRRCTCLAHYGPNTFGYEEAFEKWGDFHDWFIPSQALEKWAMLEPQLPEQVVHAGPVAEDDLSTADSLPIAQNGWSPF